MLSTKDDLLSISRQREVQEAGSQRENKRERESERLLLMHVAQRSACTTNTRPRERSVFCLPSPSPSPASLKICTASVTLLCSYCSNEEKGEGEEGHPHVVLAANSAYICVRRAFAGHQLLPLLFSLNTLQGTLCSAVFTTLHYYTAMFRPFPLKAPSWPRDLSLWSWQVTRANPLQTARVGQTLGPEC